MHRLIQLSMGFDYENAIFSNKVTFFVLIEISDAFNNYSHRRTQSLHRKLTKGDTLIKLRRTCVCEEHEHVYRSLGLGWVLLSLILSFPL